MRNLGSETCPSSQIFSIPSYFRNHLWGTETGAFAWPSCYCFCKKSSIYNINPYYFKHKLMKFLSLKKVWDGQSDIHITITCILIFLQITIRSQKIDVKLNKTLKLKFILMFFDSVYPTRPSDTVAKLTIYLFIIPVERLFK